MKKLIASILDKFGYRIIRSPRSGYIPPDMEQEFRAVHEKCKDYTMTSVLRMYALYQSVRYIEERNIPGSIVECGVWKGGSMMLAALTLKNLSSQIRSDTRSENKKMRNLYLYDTFEGMTEPGSKDVTVAGNYPAKKIWNDAHTKPNPRAAMFMAYAPLEEVKKNLRSTGYPENSIIFVKGKVEETIPGTVPEQIALLRLDTDWYESTYHSLRYLFPKLQKGGVLILDDYGHWKGARDAVEQYFSEQNISLFLHRIDDAGRIGIKS